MPRILNSSQRIALTVVATLATLLLTRPVSSATVSDLLDRAAEEERAVRYSAAESLYVDAVELLELRPKSPEQLINTYLDLAGVRIRLCRFDAAQEEYDRALLLATTALGAENLTVARALHGLGRVEFLRGRYG